MPQYMKFVLVWLGVSVLALTGVYTYTLNQLDHTKQSLQKTEQYVKKAETQNSVLTQDVKAAHKLLKGLQQEQKDMQKQIQTISKEKAALEQKNDELRKQITQKEAELRKKPKTVVVPSRGSVSTSHTVYMNSSAYTAYCNGCSGKTRTGLNLRANPHLKVIAVDPNVIPLGSKVYVEGYGYAVAADTGGAIKGNRIDVFIPDLSDARKWGRKTIPVKVLN